jgi:hypothetical protein
MRSSISSSDAEAAAVLDPAIAYAPPLPRERPQAVPASPRPARDPAAPFERQVPSLPWLRLFVMAMASLCVLMTGWEIAMRHLGLRPGDLDDGRAQWAAERRKVDSGPRDEVVLIGDSRMLFDTDLSVWQSLTGRKPIQLALPATNAQAFLHDLATDEHFAGLVVVGTADIAYFRDGSTYYASMLDYVKTESPSQRSGGVLYKELSRAFGFLDSQYTLFALVEQNDWPERPGVFSPYQDIWKISETYDDRQTWLWDRIERDAYLRAHVQKVWKKVFSGEPIAAGVVDRAIAATRADVERIRARGGEVAFIRPPSAMPILESERRLAPRDKVWDRLLRETGTVGVHFEDYPQMRGLESPDWSHLSRASATAYTDAYVRVLMDRVGWLKAHPAPAVAR